ncbi:A-kinase anchor protein 9 isoform X2 [Gouania willdenowi]|uniref:A-kinase anchor protein 9 isoform X2 n=1 Tax=Gouania willdenowi TaxID=441366 RepID=UPI001056B4C5|nr:A-kinase anchor protein 9 isoform X2 [Gouania willdenowi]
MEDEERQKKLEAGKAKLAEYRLRKAHADSQKKQKKKKKKKPEEDSEGDSQERVTVDPDSTGGVDEVLGEEQDGSQEEKKGPPATEFTFGKTLRSGETVRHDQTYHIEPESEVSTTAEDYSSEVNGSYDEMSGDLLMATKEFFWEETESLEQLTKGGMMQDMEDGLSAKTRAVEEQELEELRSTFGTEGIQQLQDFEAALKQRDSIITQLTSNLQQAREEKDEIMREFLALTEQSQKLQIQFQQLQAGETLRNTSHSSTAADLVLARQQLVQSQHQLEEMNIEVRKHQEISNEQLELISQLQHQLSEMEMSGRRSEEIHIRMTNEKDLLIAEHKKVILNPDQSLVELREAEQNFVQTLTEKDLLISEKTDLITKHEQSLTQLREELAHIRKTIDEKDMQQSNEKDLIIAEQQRIISERNSSLMHFKDEMENSKTCLQDFQARIVEKEAELKKYADNLESTKAELELCKTEMESYKFQLEKEQMEFLSCKEELSSSRQKEQMSSHEIMQLMGTVEDLQRRCHQGSLSESDTIQKMQEDTVRKLELLRAELDEMYGQQIVQMKQELNLQHAAMLQQMTEKHHAELELLKEQQTAQSSSVSTAEIETLHITIRGLQQTLEQSQTMQTEAKHELTQAIQEKLNLQARVDDLLLELHSAEDKVEQVSLCLVSQESNENELQHLRETIDNLRRDLSSAQQAATDEETKHESEVTNYKIKLEMLEREKDAVLDRMAESQEAELDRLRTQLLFSHEEELSNLRDELLRESFLNRENLLNEATVKQEKVLNELRLGFEEELRLLRNEKASSATERDELLHQIVELKEDLNLALHSSKADELVQQLQELQLELEELRKEGEERARMENELTLLRKNTEMLENQTKEKQHCWEDQLKEHELEKETLQMTKNTLNEELRFKLKAIETLTAENNQMQQQVAQLQKEVEMQRTTFSFAEKNFEVNYQQLKEEYTCLIEAKKMLEEKTLKTTLDFEAEVSSLKSQVCELEETCREFTDGKAVVEKGSTELMEKLNVSLREKESLEGKLSAVTEQLMFTESKVGQLDAELTNVRQEYTKAKSQSQMLEKELEKQQEIISEQMRGHNAKRKTNPKVREQDVEPHYIQIQSLQEEIKALQSLLQGAQAEKDSLRQTLEIHTLSLSPLSAAISATGEEPVDGESSSHKSTASGSNRRKRRQRAKQERRVATPFSDSREERREEDEEATGLVETTDSAAVEKREPRMERAVLEDSDGYQGDAGCSNSRKGVSGRATGSHAEHVVCAGVQEGATAEHSECRLRMEAQRVALSQIHAAQLELLQEEKSTQTHSLELQLQDLKEEQQDLQTSAKAPTFTSMEFQDKQLQQEESHRQEMERLRVHYQQQATDTEERHTTELLRLQQQLLEVTDGKTNKSLSGSEASGSALTEAHHEDQKLPEEEENVLTEDGVELPWSLRSAGLTTQLQALRRALYHKYVQEVAVLKEQHSIELKQLREERDQERKKGASRQEEEEEDDLSRFHGTRSSTGSLELVGRFTAKEKQDQERVEEEVAKTIVQMSVEFAQQTEQARIKQRSYQVNTSMQTHSSNGSMEEKPTSGALLFLTSEERHRAESGSNLALKKSEDGDEEVEEDSCRQASSQSGRLKCSLQDGEESSNTDTERNLLRKANKKLSEVLVEVLKTTAAAEETMSLHMQTLRESSAATQPLDSSCTLQRVDIEAGRVHTADDSTETFPGSEMSAEDVSFWSEGSEADGRLELSQQMMDSLLLGAGPQLLNEECLMSVGSRLQTALEKMLMAITDSTNQLEHARVTQTELMRESFRHNQEISELLQKQEELQERLTEEARAREQLALELHHAEGVIDGYTGERTALEEQLRQKGELQLSLEQELQVTSSRLQELEQDRLQIMEERELLSRQQDAMREHAGPRELRLVEAAMVAAPEADLLEETEKLMKEKVEVQRQAEKENTDLLKQVKLLEVDLEEQVNRVIELEFARTTETRDLRQQIQALEKQLEKNRKFLDEQAVDREHERDFFQQEIQKLEQQLKNSQKLQPGSEQRNKEVDQLTSQLKEKADWCSELLLGSEQLRRELGERNEEIDKLESRIRELEQALLASAESLEKVEQKQQHAPISEATHSTLQAQLQTEREALERKEKEICNLEEQLEQFKEELENKSEEVQQLHMQLEIQRKEISSQQQYMETRESLFQVMEAKDREIALLNENITKLQHTETASDNKELDEKDELIKDLESQVECLRSEQDRLKRNNHEELDQLNAVIEKLQQELANIEQNHAPEEDEDTKGEIEIAVCKDEYDEMKQRMDLTVNELETLKTEHSELFETYLCLREHKETVDEAGEQQQNLESELQEALREKTAGLVVMQAQVQALEKSAASRVKQLDVRIMELEDTVSERDSEITRCRLLVEQTQSDADRLQQRVFNLEENVRERMAAAIVSQATLQAFQQQQQPSGMNREPQEHTELQRSEFRDFSVPQMDSSRLSQTQQAPAAKMSHLTQKLRELETGLSAMQKDQELQQQLLTSSEEEVLEYERRLEVLMDLLNQMKTRTLRRTPSPVEASSEEQSKSSELLLELQEVRDEASTTILQLDSFRQSCSRLQEELHERNSTIEKLQDQLKKVSTSDCEEVSVSTLKKELVETQNEAAATKEELNNCKESLEKLQELLQASSEEQSKSSELLLELQEVRDEASTTKLQLDSFRQSCSRLQEELHERNSTIEKLQDQLKKVSTSDCEEVSVSTLKKELVETQNEAAATKEELNNCKESLEKLQELLQERELTIAHLKGELFQVKADEDRADNAELLQELEKVKNSTASTKEELQSYRQRHENLQEELLISEASVIKLREELQEVSNIFETTKEELRSYKQHNDKLHRELQEAQRAVMKVSKDAVSSAPSPHPPSSTTQPKKKGIKQPPGKGSAAKEKTSLSRKNSNPSSQSSNRSHSSRVSSSSSSEQQQHGAVVSDSFTQTEPLQMSDLGWESKPASDEEVQQVIGEFQERIEQMQELHAAEILDMEARHISESENLRRDTQVLQDECKTLKAVIDKLRSPEGPTSRHERSVSQFKDGYISDSSSDYSQRTGYDLPSLQQEFRTTPEGARRETDDALPDRIKTLLREVHQEGMQVLSLSELPLTEGELGGQFNAQSFAKERDALLANVESLKYLISQMQTHRDAQTSGSTDWRGELLNAVRLVFLSERSVLKSGLSSQLELLDTSDAIIHLNQLERKLAEQDAHHREAMDSLHTAERSSLISEIHHLQEKIKQLNQGVQPVLSLAGKCSIKEERESDVATNADRLLVDELKVELSQTKLELETTLKAQHKHLKELDALRAEVSQRAVEVDALTDQLTEERKTSRDLQWAAEKDRCRTGRTEESRREELEDLHLTLDEQKTRMSQLTQSLELERQAASQASQQAEQERLGLCTRLQELQVQLESERAKALETNAALGRERALRVVDSAGGELSCEAQEDEGSLLQRLQKDLDDKHAQVVHLLSQVEAQKLEVVRKDEELNLTNQRSRRDQEELLEARTQLETLQMQTLELQEELETELERRRSLEEEKERLEERLNQTGRRRGDDDRSGALQAGGRSLTEMHIESTERDRNGELQQRSSNVQSPSSSVSPHLETMSPSGLHRGPWRTTDRIVGKLQLVSSKVHSIASKGPESSTTEVDNQELSWIQSSVDDVIDMLQQSPGLPSVPESAFLLAGGSFSSSTSSNTLTERLLRQNAELTGFVSRLTEEKNDLRNHTLRLEEELRRYRQAGAGSGHSSTRRGASKTDSASLLLSQERETWTREKVDLEKALQMSQAQVARLKGEIRSDNLREITGPEADNSALKRMYGRYLRSESFRKALIYQKKYLLLLLGGFQECEEATLALLTRMGSRPTISSLESLSHRHRGLMRFRSAVRVSIALSRMRFLVKRWHKATGMSPTSCTVNRNRMGQILGTEARDSPYLHPGSVELYKDRASAGGGGGVSNSRGRTGRESPRSPTSSLHHRFHVPGDHGALTCSHLQNYDPDRALSDYISRLEALQRRLGNVTSGASSNTHLHFGLRR